MSDQRRAMVEARERYEQCVAENPERAEQACTAEKAELLARQERYEADARRAWGCAGTSTTGCGPYERDDTP